MTTAKKEFDAASWRPTVAGRRHAVASGHYLATLAAQRVLDGGGNAIDAGVTAAMALAVLQPDLVSFAGVAPTLIYLHVRRPHLESIQSPLDMLLPLEQCPRFADPPDSSPPPSEEQTPR